MEDSVSGGAGHADEAELDSTRWAIRLLLSAMARSVIDVAETETYSRPYQVGLSPLRRWLVNKLAGDLVQRVETESDRRVYRAEVSPHMLQMAQTVAAILDGESSAEARSAARELWGNTPASVRAHAPRAVEEIQRWQTRKVLSAMTLDDVIFYLQDNPRGPGLTEKEFMLTYEARRKSGPDYEAWRRLQSYLGDLSEDEVAQLIARRRSDDED